MDPNIQRGDEEAAVYFVTTVSDNMRGRILAMNKILKNRLIG